MRLIDVDALKSDYGMKDDCADCDKELRGKSKACEFDRVYTKMDFCGWLDDAPTVDAVPVLCKDCKHRDPEDRKCDCGHDIMWQLPRGDDWYCADGERKDGDHAQDKKS